jgi:hypothetical protein
MYRVVAGVLSLLLAAPALWAEDNPKDKSASPAEQYQALVKEYQDAMKAYQDALRSAKTPEERQTINKEKNPRQTVVPTLAPKFVELAEKNPKDPVAVDALIWVLSGNVGPEAKDLKAKAMGMVLRDHLDSDKLGKLCQSLNATSDKGNESSLKAILAKSPHKSVQAEAFLMLAQGLTGRANLVKRLASNPQQAKQMEASMGKEAVEELQNADPAKLEAEGEKALREFADKYAADLPANRLTSVCQQARGNGAEYLLRTLLEKDSRHEVQGVACLALAQLLKQRANGMSESEADAAKKLQEESEKNFEQAAEKYADVKLARGTVGEKAKSELFDLRHLSVGKPVPEVAGVDQDGKKFSLAEYKGKVVLLDFWSEF